MFGKSPKFFFLTLNYYIGGEFGIKLPILNNIACLSWIQLSLVLPVLISSPCFLSWWNQHDITINYAYLKPNANTDPPAPAISYLPESKGPSNIVACILSLGHVYTSASPITIVCTPCKGNRKVVKKDIFVIKVKNTVS